VRRCLTLKLRDRSNLAILAATALTIGLLSGCVSQAAGQRRLDGEKPRAGQTVFILSLGGLWFGTSTQCARFVAEWAIYRRERMVNLKIFVRAPSSPCSACCAWCSVSFSWGSFTGCGLQASLASLFGLLFLTALSARLGLRFSALAPDPELAGTLFTWVLSIDIILGGAVLPLHKMPRRWFRLQCDPSRWPSRRCCRGSSKSRTEPRLPRCPWGRAAPSVKAWTWPVCIPKKTRAKAGDEGYRLGSGIAALALAVLPGRAHGRHALDLAVIGTFTIFTPLSPVLGERVG